MWLLMALRASDKSLLWIAVPCAVPDLCSISGFTRVTLTILHARRFCGEPKEQWALNSRPQLAIYCGPRSSFFWAGCHAASWQGWDSRSFVFMGAENPLSLDTEAAFCKLILWTTALPGKCPQQLGLELLVCKEDAAQNSALLSSVLCTQRHFCLLLLPMVAFQTIPWPVMMQFLMKFIFS